MRLRPEARVGLIVFLALLSLGVVYWFFNGLGGSGYIVNAVFPNAQRLQMKAEVRMSGVLVGNVQNLELTKDNQAKVVMRIRDHYEIPKDSMARITSGGVVSVGDFYVEILPGKSREMVAEDGYLRTGQLINLENMVGQVEKLLKGINTTVATVNGVIGDKKLQRSLRNIMGNVEATTAQTAALTSTLQGAMAENRGRLGSVLANVDAATENFAAVTRDVRGAIEHGGLDKLQTALTNATEASANLSAASLKLRELAEDPNINTDLRQTVHSASQAAQSAAEIAGKLNKVLGGKVGPKPGAPLKYVPNSGARLDVFEKGFTGDFRVDYNFTMPFGQQFVRAGLFDIGETTKVNLQAGKPLDDRSAVRYGLYASKLGVGYDRKVKNGMTFSADLYRPNDPKLETKLRYDVNENWSAIVGVENLFHGGDALFGVQYRK